MLTIDPDGLVRLAAIALFGGGGFGSAFAFFRPFAAQWLSHRLERAKRRAEIEDEQARARARAEADRDGTIMRLAVAQEGLVAVLENVEARLDHLTASHRRIESHLQIPLTASTVPPEPVPAAPRRQITGHDFPRVVLPLDPPPQAGEKRGQ